MNPYKTFQTVCRDPHSPLPFVLAKLEVAHALQSSFCCQQWCAGRHAASPGERCSSEIFYEIFQVSFGRRHLGGDSDLAPAPFDGHNPSIKISSFSSRISLGELLGTSNIHDAVFCRVGAVKGEFQNLLFPPSFATAFFHGLSVLRVLCFVVCLFVYLFSNSWTFLASLPLSLPHLSVHVHTRVRVRGQTSGQCSCVLCEIQRLLFLMTNAFTYSTI